MWQCKKCRAEWKSERIPPQVDEEGFCVFCPICDHRIGLMNLGTRYGRFVLTQPYIDWADPRWRK